jgi:ABC-type microcin C transport system permease subunit YejE
MVSAILILVLILVVAIWLIIEFKRFRHKILAVFLILLILFTYFSFAGVVKDKNLDLKTFDGMKEAGKLYFVWLGHAFKNVKVVTSNVIDMDWRMNETIEQNKTIESSDVVK